MATQQARLALVGGTGLNEWAGAREREQDTPWGPPSAPVTEAEVDGKPVLFLPRHGRPHRIPPHRINYRANLWALHAMGARRVVAINAVGGISAGMSSGVLALPDQIIDYTWGREHSFYDGSDGRLEHVDFSEPYDGELREGLRRAAAASRIDLVEGGVYAATQGPRLETAAEVARLERDGCDVVGMTGMPEAALARELGLAYACVCLVVNPAAGKGTGPITMAEIDAALLQGMNQVRSLLQGAIRELA